MLPLCIYVFKFVGSDEEIEKLKIECVNFASSVGIPGDSRSGDLDRIHDK
jgi:hypothetical protein